MPGVVLRAVLAPLHQAPDVVLAKAPAVARPLVQEDVSRELPQLTAEPIGQGQAESPLGPVEHLIRYPPP